MAMSDFNIKYNAYAQQFEDALKLRFEKLKAVPEPLLSAMRYSIFQGGKRIRPVLCLSACAMFCGDAQPALPFALAVEMIHTYSLIHDDLPCMDNDDMRRGKPTNHRVFGEAMAVLAGDALLNLAYETMLEACLSGGSAQTAAANAVAIAAGALGMVGGQCADMGQEGRADGGLQELEYIHLHKTAKLLEASVISGALCGGANESQLSPLKNYARSLGLAFQITDDILDVSGDSEMLGKATEKDGAKLTYPGLFGLERARNLANEHTESALDCLNNIGADASFLRGLALWLSGRNK